MGARVDALFVRGLAKDLPPPSFLMGKASMIARVSNCATLISGSLCSPSLACCRLSSQLLDFASPSQLPVPAFGVLGHEVASATTDSRCPCGDRALPKHNICFPALPPHLKEALSRLLCLDTDLFSSARTLSNMRHWCCFDNNSKQLGSLGSPWRLNWSGHFILCAPWLPAGTAIASRCLRRAVAATRSCRPTRIVLAVRGLDPILTARYGAVYLSHGLSHDPSISLLLLQNEAAEALCPIDWNAVSNSGLALIHAHPKPSQPVPRSASPNPRQGGSFFASECFALPFVSDSFAAAPSDLPVHLEGAFKRLATFDRYVGLLGLLPKGFSDLVRWHYCSLGLDERSASWLASKRTSEASRELFSAARRFFNRSASIREAWRACLSGPALEAKEDSLALAAHVKARVKAASRFSAVMALTEAKVRFRAQRHHVRRRLGLSTIRALLQLYPQWTFGGIPPEPVKSLLADFKQEATPRTRCNGRLRINTRLRPYDDGSYVLLPSEQRSQARRKLKLKSDY